jgi:hypothetical protein
MPDQDGGLVILEDAPLEGTASVVERLGDEDDEAASLALDQHLDQQEVGKAGDRGMVRNLLDKFRRMREVADLGTHPTKLEWLAFHVPPGGTGQLQFEVAGTQHAAVQLKVMGLGGGSGRKVTFGAERDLGVRDQCFALGAWIDVRLRTFRGRDDDAPEELRVDVEAVTNSYVEPLQPCALCFSAAARRPLRARPTGTGWDLTSDDKGVTERLTVEFTREAEMEVTLAFPGVSLGGLVPGIAMNREVRSRCEALYMFPGRANFVGYELVGRRKDFPFWGRS